MADDGDAPAEDPYMARYYRRERERQDKARADLRYLAGMLARLGVRTASADFDGYGDDGTIENIQFVPAPPAGLPDGASGWFEHLVSDVLPGAWEVNEGSFGTVTLDTATGEAEVEQYDYTPLDDEDDCAGEGE